MVKAFVFGKFLPFHQGHEAMIRFALTNCDTLTVVVCCSNKETISGNIRARWIEDTLRVPSGLEIIVYDYDEAVLPNTSTASMTVSETWATAFKALLPDHTLLITSEPYGDMVAGYMNIRHIPFDPERTLFPISATAIRQDAFKNWSWLPQAVRPHFAVKIVILGTESTGKSTLAAQLAAHYHATLVNEAGRDIIPHSDEFSIDDLYKVADAHAANMRIAASGQSPIIIIDTDVHITCSYARFVFNEELLLADDIFQANKASLYLYLNKDVPYVQDGTRLTESSRDLLDASHRQTLDKYGVTINEITGNWGQRLAAATTLIDDLLASPRLPMINRV